MKLQVLQKRYAYEQSGKVIQTFECKNVNNNTKKHKKGNSKLKIGNII